MKKKEIPSVCVLFFVNLVIIIIVCVFDDMILLFLSLCERAAESARLC
jgi:hypothetical protein